MSERALRAARILLVDDQRNMRTTLAMILRGAHYDVDEADSADDACERVESGDYDLVLTDLKMSERSGMDVLSHVRKHHLTPRSS